jgi:hypothetical protein
MSYGSLRLAVRPTVQNREVMTFNPGSARRSLGWT